MNARAAVNMYKQARYVYCKLIVPITHGVVALRVILYHMFAAHYLALLFLLAVQPAPPPLPFPLSRLPPLVALPCSEEKERGGEKPTGTQYRDTRKRKKGTEGERREEEDRTEEEEAKADSKKECDKMEVEGN